jgi:hypothetical protein
LDLANVFSKNFTRAPKTPTKLSVAPLLANGGKWDSPIASSIASPSGGGLQFFYLLGTGPEKEGANLEKSVCALYISVTF